VVVSQEAFFQFPGKDGKDHELPDTGAGTLDIRKAHGVFGCMNTRARAVCGQRSFGFVPRSTLHSTKQVS